MANQNAFRDYARLDADDPAAEICYLAAVDAAKQAGVPEMQGCAKYDLLIYALALFYFENRGFSPGMAVDGRTQTNWAERQITAFLIELDAERKIAQGAGEANGGA